MFLKAIMETRKNQKSGSILALLKTSLTKKGSQHFKISGIFLVFTPDIGGKHSYVYIHVYMDSIDTSYNSILYKCLPNCLNMPALFMSTKPF